MAIDPISIQSALRSVSGEGRLGAPALNPTPRNPEIGGLAAPGQIQGPSFKDTLSHYIDEVNHQVLDADNKLGDLAAGKSGDVHSALISMQKADLQVRLLVETRNKVINAYQEMMRMQA